MMVLNMNLHSKAVTKMTKVTITLYPASLKHFIEKCKQNPNFRPSITKVRDAAIDILLNTKK